MDQAPRARQRALADTVEAIERHIARRGWDLPVAVFALVRTGDAVERDPQLANELPMSSVRAAERDSEHLTAVEQDSLPAAGTLEDLIGALSWPHTVDGTALVVERVVLPPEAEAALPDDPHAAIAFLEHHPAREDVRIAAGALRSGETWCSLRVRAHDRDDAVSGGPDLVPDLTDALRGTLH